MVFDEQTLDRQLSEARAALRQVRSGAADAPEPAEIIGEAAGGHLRVILGTDGRLSHVDLHPALMREGSEFLSQQIAVAVNAALDARAEVSRSAEPVPDLDAMTATVERLQDEGVRQMQQITTSFTAAIRRATGAADG